MNNQQQKSNPSLDTFLELPEVLAVIGTPRLKNVAFKSKRGRLTFFIKLKRLSCMYFGIDRHRYVTTQLVFHDRDANEN